MEVRLSAKRLGDVFAVLEAEKKFKFIVGKDEREYVCSLVQACFISGKVCRLVASDSSISELRVLPNENSCEFELLELLWSGKCIEVSKSNSDALSKLSTELENEELNANLMSFSLSNEKISKENCFFRFGVKKRLGLDYSEEIGFISSNLFEFSASNLAGLGVSELECVLVHESLKIENESALCDSILELISRDESYSALLKYIQFEYLDEEHLDLFFKSVYPEHIDGVLWESITKFITNSVKKHPQPRSGKRYMEGIFKYSSSTPFNGIISRLRSECGGNPHSKGVMNITASSNGCNQCYNVVDYGWTGDWYTNNIANSWIQFDFKDRLISLESYIIKSCSNNPGQHHLRQWKIEYSSDASSWTELDSRNTTDLNGRYFTKHFTCSKPSNEFYRYIRLTQTGPNMYGNQHYLEFSEIEFFGKLSNRITRE